MANNPPVDYGFRAVIPRIVRTQYKLTPTEKWLYVCLKDLCGDKGVCYRSLRDLEQETDISIAMLCKSIPKLHKAGLIHAEKKRRDSNPTAKEVWHITIVDIWGANVQAHPTKRSPNKHSSQNVPTENNNVHHMNENREECSPNEQQCSQAKHEASGKQEEGSKNITEVRTVSNTLPTYELTAEQQKWFDTVYCQAKFIAIPPRLTNSLKGHVITLSQRVKTVEQLNSLYDYTAQRPYLIGKEIKPGNLAHCLNDWYQTQIPREPIPFPTQPIVSEKDSYRGIVKDEKYWKFIRANQEREAREKAAREARKLASGEN